jgi:hypothetical protein
MCFAIVEVVGVGVGVGGVVGVDDALLTGVLTAAATDGVSTAWWLDVQAESSSTGMTTAVKSRVRRMTHRR